MTISEIRARILYFAEETADLWDAEVVDVEYSGPMRHAIVRVTVDKIDGIGLDECALISRKLGDILDMEDLIPHRYRLEVSSPGVERPLRKPRDFARFKGERVKVCTTHPIDGETVHIGILSNFENNKIHIYISDDKVREILLDDISKANLQFESPFGKKSKKRKNKSK